MKNTWKIALLALLLPAGAFAAADAGAGVPGAGMFFAVTAASAALGLAIAALGGALGQGNLAGRAMESIARQPEAAGRIQTAMLLGLAFVESLVIYVLLIAFILLFANPFRAIFVG